MVGDFINLWYFQNGTVTEKVSIRLVNIKGSVTSRGIYISNVAVKLRNGQQLCHRMYTNDIHRKFVTMEDAAAYLKLTFEEFVEKYPKHEGKARFGNAFYINRKWISNS